MLTESLSEETIAINYRYDKGEHIVKKKRTNKTITPRSYIQYFKLLEIKLPGRLFVTIFEWFPFTKWQFKAGQDNRNNSLGLMKGWPRPLNRDKNYSNRGSNFSGFWQLIARRETWNVLTLNSWKYNLISIFVGKLGNTDSSVSDKVGFDYRLFSL